MAAQPQGPWNPGFHPTGPGALAISRFPGGSENNWVSGIRMSMGSQWRGPNPLPTPMGPNPFEEALIKDMIPPANEIELRSAERDSPSSIPIDKVCI